MNRIAALKHLIQDAFTQREMVRQHSDKPSEASDKDTVDARGAPNAKRSTVRYFIRNAAFFTTACIVSLLVVWLNAHGIFYAWPSSPQPTATEQSRVVARVAPPVVKPSQAAVARGLATTALPIPSSTPPHPRATAAEASPSVSAPLNGLIVDTLDTVSAATAALSQLLTAEESGLATTWCSLATTLDITQCDSELSTQWDARQSYSGGDHATSGVITIDRPSGNEKGYTFSVHYSDHAVLITMVRDGQHWRLSDQDYQKALLNGGILSPLIGELTQAVIELL